MSDLRPTSGRWSELLPKAAESNKVEDRRTPLGKLLDADANDPTTSWNDPNSPHNVEARRRSDELMAQIADDKPVPQTPEQLRLGEPAAAITASFGNNSPIPNPNAVAAKATAPVQAFGTPSPAPSTASGGASVPGDVRSSIVRAAKENGIDPSLALAIAGRESSFDVNGRAPGSSAYGLFQMLKSERGAYGGSSQDPYEQSTAWAHYIQGTQAEMAKHLGRPPTGPELYLGHYFGGTRAARLASGEIPGQTPVQAVFSPAELAANPNIVRAGTTGALSSSIMSDISRRQVKYGGEGPDQESEGGFDPAKFGTAVGGQDKGFDPAQFGTSITTPAPVAQPPTTQPVQPQPSQPADFSQFGSPVSPPAPPAAS